MFARMDVGPSFRMLLIADGHGQTRIVDPRDLPPHGIDALVAGQFTRGQPRAVDDCAHPVLGQFAKRVDPSGVHLGAISADLLGQPR